jgi:hypothetical protein
MWQLSAICKLALGTIGMLQTQFANIDGETDSKFAHYTVLFANTI